MLWENEAQKNSIEVIRYLELLRNVLSNKTLTMEYLLRTDLTFRQMLTKLYQELSIEKSDPSIKQLDVAAKYELIRMRGEGLIEFDEKSIHLSEQGKGSLNLISDLRQVG